MRRWSYFGWHRFGGRCLCYIGFRPLSEDNSVRSQPSTLINLKAGHRFDRQITLSAEVLNLLDCKLSDVDYYYGFQLKTETFPAADISTHPSEPRTPGLGLHGAR